MAKSMAKTSQPKSKKVVETVEEKVVDNTKEEKAVKKSAPKKEKEYSPTDTVRCVSVTHGELIMRGRKSDLMYTWSGYGDVAYVEYQDLYAAKTRKSDFIYLPFFVIEDDELLSQSRWADVREFYENMYSFADVNDVLQLDTASFRQTIENAPKGLQKAIQVEMVTRLEDGTFDSLQKIKLMDEICDTDLMCYVK